MYFVCVTEQENHQHTSESKAKYIDNIYSSRLFQMINPCDMNIFAGA